MTLRWGNEAGYGFASDKADNAVACVDRVYPTGFKLTMRADVNDTSLPLFGAPRYVPGEYQTLEEARAMAGVIYRLHANVVTS